APVTTLFALAYSAAFWNSNSSAGFPVQAIKSQLVDDPNAADSASDIYRAIENFNLLATIKSNPVFGTGFGKPFLQPIPLPDISGAFPLWQFYPHNSMLHLWAAGGVLAVAAWLYLAYAGLRGGTKATLAAAKGYDLLVALTGTAIVLMVTLYSYLDISFDNQTLLLFPIGFAFIHLIQDGIDADAAAADVERREPEVSDSRRERRDVGV
ncbi:MAG: O-antigen ligase family protein, partial [Actinomycetota bacterium]